MKPQISTFSFLILMLLFLDPTTVSAQDGKVTDKITRALQAADASLLAVHFNASIDLSLPGEEGAFSKKQAEQIMKMFFAKNPVKKFSLEHTGNSNNGSRYLIGSYECSTQKTYRVYMLIKGQSGSGLIQQLQFEED